MENIAFPEEAQAQEHLLCVHSDRFQIYTYVSPKFLQNFTQVNASTVSDIIER